MLARVKSKTAEVRAKIMELMTVNPYLPKLAAITIIGFIVSSASVFESLSSFGIAYVAAVPIQFSAGGLIGVLFGYLLLAESFSLKYICSAAIAFAAVFFLGRRRKRKPLALWIPSVIASLSTAAFSLATSYAKGFMLYDIALALAETVLSGGAAFFFSRTLTGTQKGKRWLMNERDTASLVVTAAIMIIGLCRFEISGFSVGRAAAVLCILISAHIASEKGGAMSGLLAGTAIAIGNPSYILLAGSFGLSGMIAGVFSEFEKVGTAAAFVIVNAIMTAFSKGAVPITILYEVMAASLIYMLMPSKIADKLKIIFFSKAAVDETRGIKDSVTLRLNFASKALIDVSETVTAVSERLRKSVGGDVSIIYEKVADRVCRSCGMKMFCWQKNYNDTMNKFNDITVLLKRKGRIFKNDMPDYFAKQCCKVGVLFEEININYSDYMAKSNAYRRISDVRSVVAEQFAAMGETLARLSDEMEFASIADSAQNSKVISYFQRHGAEPSSVSAITDIYDRTRIEVCFEREKIKSINAIMLCLDLSELCGKCFDTPAQTVAGNLIKLTFFEKAGLTAKVGAFQICHDGNQLCGDSYDYFADGNGKARMIISDGMGSGGAAAIDSSMASTLLSKLLSGGFGFDPSLKIVNSALLVKSGEESLATIDAVDIDLYTGIVDFYKAGAPVSFIKKRGKAEVLESESLPAGILKGISFDKKSVHLTDGDVVLLVSDGVISSGYNWILAELDLFSTDDADFFAKRICTEAKRRRLDGHDDDITALCAVIGKGVCFYIIVKYIYKSQILYTNGQYYLCKSDKDGLIIVIEFEIYR